LESLRQFILERRRMLGLRGWELVAPKCSTEMVDRFRSPIWWTSSTTAASHRIGCSNNSQRRSRRISTFFTTSAGRIQRDLTPSVVSEDRLAAWWRAFGRDLEGDGKVGTQESLSDRFFRTLVFRMGPKCNGTMWGLAI
jgi:hypothetical protein